MSKALKHPRPVRVILAPEIIAGAVRQWPMLRPLLPVGAGYRSHQEGPIDAQADSNQTVFVYCLKGSGWCDTNGKLQKVQAGDLMVLPGRKGNACAAQAMQPWTLLWINATGETLPGYLRELGAADGPQVLRLGEDPQVVRLFYDVLRLLESAVTFPRLLQATHALGLVLALAIDKCHTSPPQSQDIARKVAAVITYMSEHLDEPLSASNLARLANLSPAYFSSVFRVHTGSSPRDYLHLLRIHRACQMLQTTALSVKGIAARVGYQDQFHFSRRFKAFQGVSPTQYRDRQRGPAD